MKNGLRLNFQTLTSDFLLVRGKRRHSTSFAFNGLTAKHIRILESVLVGLPVFVAKLF